LELKNLDVNLQKKQHGSQDIEFKYLLNKISSLTRINLSQYRESYIKRRIDLRMKLKGEYSYARYAKLIENDNNEMKELMNVLTVNVTEFMRDKTPFDFFRKKLLPEIVKRKSKAKSRLLRIWSAGCSYGEEPYSIAISISEELGNDWNVSIYATDIDLKCLESARRGIYKKEQLNNLSRNEIFKYFIKINGEYEVIDSIKKQIRFKRHDLTSEGPISRYFDVIFCRNVMIYFNEKQKFKIFSDFYQALIKNGYLIIGKSETLHPDFKNKFKPISLSNKIYIRQ